MGCNQGHRSDSQGQPTQTVVLDFGKAAFNGSSYGTIGFRGLGFITIAQIELAAKQYMQGFWDCTAVSSRSFMYVAVGTNNCTIPAACSGSATYYAHGQAWAQMIARIQYWLANQSCCPPNQLTTQLDAIGGNDMELNWDTVSRTTDWANGFNSVGTVGYLDYGDAASCPPVGVCNNGWTQGDIYNVAWGIPAAFALPEIYNTLGNNAKQWQQISLWAVTHGLGKILFNGAMAQSVACADVGDPCNGTNNTSDAAWQQLYSELNSDSRTSNTPINVTNISWQTS
jgi:hypothetical protein